MGINFNTISRSSLLKSSAIYTLSSLINASIPFLFIPLLTRHLSPSDYGLLSIVAIMINIATPFVGLSVNSAIGRRYFEGESKNFSRYVGNAIYILLSSVIGVLILILALNKIITRHTGVTITWQFIILAIAFSQFISFVLLAIWQAMVKPLAYGAFQIGHSILNFSVSVILIFSIKLGWEGRILGQLGAAAIFATIALIILYRKRYINFQYNLEDIKHALRFSVPLIPHTLGGLAIAFTDRIFIANMIGLKETGIYTVAYQLGSALGLINTSFITAYVPWLYETLAKDEHALKVKVVKYSYWYFFFQVVIVGIAILIGPIVIPLLVGEAYAHSSLAFFNLIVGAYGLNGMYLMVAGFIFYSKKTYLLSTQTFIVAIVNVPLCYFMISVYGALGAAISMIVVYALLFTLTWILSNKVIKMPWGLK